MPFTEVRVIAPLFFDNVFADFIALVLTNCSNKVPSNAFTVPVPVATILPGILIFEETISISFAARTLPSILTAPLPAFEGDSNADKSLPGLFL